MAKGLGSSKVSGDLGAAHPATRADATHVGAPGAKADRRGGANIPMIVAPSGETVRVGGYEVIGTLGRGGMGVVYEVADDATNGIFALKTIETRFLELPESNAEGRFRQEISVLERLDHPSVIRLYDSGFARHPMGYDLAFFVMERLEGDTLDPDIKAGRIFSLEDTLLTMLQLTDALDYLAKNGVLHRDIKPANIFRERGGRVVLMDFGLARSEELTRLTIAGQIVGTFGYMSPERLTGKKLGIASDVYALGVVFYQMLAGRHPFGSPSPTEMLEAIRRGPPMPDTITRLRKGDELRAMLLSMLSYGVDQRPSPAQLRQRIEDLVGALEESSPTTRRPSDRLPARAAPKTRPSGRSSSTKTFTPRSLEPPSDVEGTVEAQSALTPVIERGTEPGDSGRMLRGSAARPEVHVSGVDLGAPLASQPLSQVPFMPAPRGPTWGTVGLFTTAAACVAFLGGLLVGRMGREEIVVPAGTASQVATRTDGRTPAATPRPIVEERRTTAAARPSEDTPEAPVRAAASFTSAADAYAYGQRLIADGKHGEAIGILNRALELNPAYADAHKLLGDAYAGTGDPERAASHYKIYLALRPTADDAPLVKKALKDLTP